MLGIGQDGRLAAFWPRSVTIITFDLRRLFCLFVFYLVLFIGCVTAFSEVSRWVWKMIRCEFFFRFVANGDWCFFAGLATE